MCGIVGVVRRRSRLPVVEDARAERAMASIRHRGPDADGEFRDDRVWFGHRRLSILDLTEAGNQPMTIEDGNLVMIYNGEVYNFRDLAADLSLSNLRSGSDTEVILRAFERLGTAAFPQLNGMFAFAVYDRAKGKLWLVRDRLGIKPLYYRIDDEGLFFASEIKGIVALMGESPSCDSSALHEWLYFGNSLAGRTLYNGIQQLPPAHSLELDLKTFATRRQAYWSLSSAAAPRNGNVATDDVVVETRRLLEAAVRRQLISDVPVGVFLSGGVDSSAITAIASRCYDGKLATYSAGFDDLRGVDERPKARRVARYYGTDHHEFQIGGASLPDLVEKMVAHHDMPFSDAANIPLYLMATAISGGIKVVLQGDGGDELFGGYRRYASLRYRRFLKPVAHWSRFIEGAMPESFFWRRVRRYAHAFASDDLASTMSRLLTPVDPNSEPESLLARPMRDALARHDPFARYREAQSDFAQFDIGSQMSLVDLSVELPDIFLEKVDRSTMAASLEVRVPFLDHDLVDYVVRIPGTQKMPWGRKKWLLKKVLQGIVPADVLSMPKTGFSVPFAYWLKTSLKPMFFDSLARFVSEQPDVLDEQQVRRSFAAMEVGELDRSNTLWNILNLMVWCRQSKVTIVP